jgi:hypothetical protein
MSITKTYGESKVEGLFKQFAETEWRYWSEPNIITKRGTFKPDFVAVNGHKGIFAIEVKDYVELVAATPDLITIKMKSGDTVQHKNPMMQARSSAEQLSNLLVAREERLGYHTSRHDTLAFPYFYCVIFPNLSVNILSQVVNAGIWEHGSVLGMEDLTTVESLSAALLNVPGRRTLRKGEIITRETIDLIRGVIDPNIIVIPTGNPNKELGTLTIGQEKEITSPVGDTEPEDIKPPVPENGLIDEAVEIAENTALRLLRGVAGSGKSLVLTRRAQYILEQKPNYKILVVTFNEDLANDLRNRINTDEISTIHFHKLCWDIFSMGQQYNVSAVDNWLRNEKQATWIAQNGFTIEFMADEFKYRKNLGVFESEPYLELERKGREAALGKPKRQLINTLFEKYLQHQFQQRGVIDFEDFAYRAIDALRRPGHPYYRKFDVVMIDEAQDFAPSWIRVMKLLVKRSGLIFIAEDPNQSIFNQFSWEEKKLSVVGRSRQLRVPFRCTEQITAAAFSLIAADPILSRNSDETIKPDLNTYRLREGESPKLICFSSQAEEIQFLQVQVARLLSQGVSPKSIAVIFPEAKLLERKFEWAKPLQIYAKSFRNVKGLEFEHVFVVCLDMLDVPMDDEVLVARTRKRIYTMMMRARDYLALTCTGNLPAVVQPIENYVDQVQQGV